MSLYGALDKTKHFSEFGDPLVTDAGVLSAATRKAKALVNLGLTAIAAEINKLAGVVAGTIAASKALVVDANKSLDDAFGIRVGTGTGIGTPANTLKVDTTSTGNGADVTEDNLISYSLPANSLVANGKGLRITAWGICAANADNKTIKLYFGTAVLATPTAATNGKNWYLEMEVYRTGLNAQAVFGVGQVDTTAVTPLVTTAAITETAAITIKATGQAGAANANDIVQKGLIVQTI